MKARLATVPALLLLAASHPAVTAAAPGDGGPATEAVLDWPSGLALDAAGNLFVAERRGNRVRRVDAGTGEMTTVAGTGERGYSGDGGPAVEAAISTPESVAVDAAGNLFIADRGNARVRRVDSETGVITTVAGSGEAGFSGDGGPATAATLRRPHVLTFDPAGNLVIGDSFNQRIRRVARERGVIETLYGSGEEGVSADGIDARAASFLYFGALTYGPGGDLWLNGWGDRRVRRIDAETGVIETVAGDGEARSAGDGGPAAAASIHGPYGLAIDGEGNVYVAEAEAGRVRQVDAETGIVTTYAGGGSPE